MDEAPSFGRWLRLRRRALDLTQAELARRVGYSEVTIRKIEADELRPSKQIAERLAEQLDLPLADRPAFLRFARGDTSAPLPPASTPPTPQSTPPSPPEPALSTLTLLFTDIEGSTRLWQDQPQAMHAALARHDALLRQAIERHGGRVFKTVGDAFYAAFPTAAPALAAAAEAQRALAADQRPKTKDEKNSLVLGPSSLVLKVRMALASGAVNEREGDYFGPPLNRAARLLGLGHGGQILLAQATYELVRDHLRAEDLTGLGVVPTAGNLSGLELRDLGEHHLRDFERAERVFQVVAPGLPADFPPLKSADRRPTNLVVPRDALIGREREVAAVKALLMRPDVGLVTLTGPGGTGKTRLALQLAANLVDQFAHGVYFVDLAPISNSDLVATTIAQTLGVREQGGVPLLAVLKSYLEEKELLLVLDNFEQVVVAGSGVAELLAAAPHLKVLTTSRVPLHIRGEHEYAVPPLRTPDPRHLPSLDRLTQYEAVRLFIERVRALKSDFTITNDNAPAVAEICHQLDGLPLAIELAAARVKFFAPSALLQRLGSRLKVLTGGAHDRPARQQTLRAAIEWSYTLLDEAEKALFRRLGVFVGGFTLESAETVCNTEGDLGDTVEGVTSLLDKSLLRQVDQPDGEPRFTMLETIREYAVEQLANSEEAAILHRHHAEYFLDLAERADTGLKGPEQVTWVQQLKLEHDNMRAVLAWSLKEPGGTELGLRLAGSLTWFWYLGYFLEARAWYEGLLKVGSGAPSSIRAKALYGAGVMAYIGRDLEVGRAWFDQSATLWREVGDQRELGYALHGLGLVTERLNELETAGAVYCESAALLREAGDQWALARTLFCWAWVAEEQHDYPAARLRHMESEAIFRKVGDRWGLAFALAGLADTAMAQDDHLTARPLFEESVSLFNQIEARWLTPRLLDRLGDIALSEGHYDEARSLYQQSLEAAYATHNKEYVCNSLERLARLDWQLGHPHRAARLLGAGESFVATGGVRRRWGLWDEESIATLRREIAQERLKASWTEGRTMTMEQTVAYALGESET